MNSEKDLFSSPPYTYSTVQPTNSFINPFTSNESSQLIVLDTNPTLTEVKSGSTCCVTCLGCLQCCATTMEVCYCCCVLFQCFAEICR